jgi:predicted HNH restriction endonuclease
MGKKLLNTPRGRIRSALRQLWLRSRERASTLKRDGYTCQICGRKQSKVKGKEFSVQVHHKDGITNWEEVIDSIYDNILCDPDYLETICKKCHDGLHGKD